MKNSIILGLDPGSRITGYGLIETKGNRSVHLDNGAIYTESAPTFPDRLVLIFQGVQKIIQQFQPQAVAIESIFFAKNVQSAFKLGHARGAALTAAGLSGCPIAEYAPRAIKLAVAGYGAATKEQVQKMVKALLNLPQVAEENASDALAVALCHAHSAGMNQVLAQAKRS